MVEHAGDEMRHGRDDFTAARRRKIGEDGGGDLAPDIRKRVSVVKKGTGRGGDTIEENLKFPRG